MTRIRPRDARAILFCITTTLVLLAASYLALRSVIISAALTAAWLAWVLTRPRMRRVARRLRGETDDWTGYYDG